MSSLYSLIQFAVEEEFDETLVTPGPIGFTVIAVVAVVAILLIVDMVRRIRRNTYRGIVQEEILAEAEAALREADGTSDTSGTDEPSAPSA